MRSTKEKTKVSRGSEAFSAQMPAHGDQKTMADRLGVQQDQVSRWASGARRPDPAARRLIEQECGISWTSWDEAPIADAVRPHRDRVDTPTGTVG